MKFHALILDFSLTIVIVITGLSIHLYTEHLPCTGSAIYVVNCTFPLDLLPRVWSIPGRWLRKNRLFSSINQFFAFDFPISGHCLMSPGFLVLKLRSEYT